ncbi:hypothetical protein JXA32_13330, partial [Candidatus Sumerlaeota bacterium]|nr:hypothetical protein [Candidatus Sumerlaeota bacterium]
MSYYHKTNEMLDEKVEKLNSALSQCTNQLVDALNNHANALVKSPESSLKAAEKLNLASQFKNTLYFCSSQSLLNAIPPSPRFFKA